MKDYFKRLPNIAMVLVSVFLLALSSACTQIKSDNNPYTGFYQYESDPTINFIVREQDGKIVLRDVWGIEELDLNETHGFTWKEVGLNGQFSSLKDAKFQRYVGEINGQKYQYKRIQTEPSLAFFIIVIQLSQIFLA